MMKLLKRSKPHDETGACRPTDPSYWKASKTFLGKLKLLRSTLGWLTAVRETDSQPRSFYPFPQLPDELQIMIWRFALLNPRVIRFEYTGSDDNGCTQIVPTGPHPLLVTTEKSREVALAGLKDSMHSVSYCKTEQALDAGISTYLYSMPFKPDRDILLLENRWLWHYVSNGYAITSHSMSEPLGLRGNFAVKHLAIGGFEMPISLWMGRSDSTDDDIQDLAQYILKFQGLEDLILIKASFLSWRRIRSYAKRLIGRSAAGRWLVRCCGRLAGIFYGEHVRYSIQRYGEDIWYEYLPSLIFNPDEGAWQTEKWLEYKFECMAGSAEDRMSLYNRRAMELTGSDAETFRLSEWWRNPKVRIMTKTEFKKHCVS